jgi:hypothetical protein
MGFSADHYLLFRKLKYLQRSKRSSLLSRTGVRCVIPCTIVVYGCKSTVLLHFVLMIQACPFSVQGEMVIFFRDLFNAASLSPSFCSAYVLCMYCCVEFNLLLKIFSGSCKLFSHMIRYIKNLLSKCTMMFLVGIFSHICIVQNVQCCCQLAY